ncbi:MAG TPA: OmpH family outer membrane protein [Thermoanaerobaculia bacterium]|nr:OmpH family outer membrane protein [Thermoanaerobaculia bacterium]
MVHLSSRTAIHLLLALLGLLAVSTPALAQESAPKIAVVNLEAVFAESAIGQSLQAEIQELEERTRLELEKERDAIATLQQQEVTATPDQRRELERRLQDHERTARRIAEDATRQAAKLETDSRQRFAAAVEPLFRTLQQEQGWDLILNKASGFVIFAGDSLDVTDLVLERLSAAG